jgi:hypothetical protein
MTAPEIPPFLRLPTELRLEIYEYLLLTRRYVTLPSSEYSALVGLKAHFIIESLPVALLRVCQLIHHEALTILGPQLRSLHLEPPKLIAESGDRNINFRHIERLDLMFCHIAMALYTLRKPNGERARHAQSSRERNTTNRFLTHPDAPVDAVQFKEINAYAFKAATRILVIQRSEHQTLHAVSNARLEIHVHWPNKGEYPLVLENTSLQVPQLIRFPIMILYRTPTMSSLSRFQKSCLRFATITLTRAAYRLIGDSDWEMT